MFILKSLYKKENTAGCPTLTLYWKYWNELDPLLGTSFHLKIPTGFHKKIAFVFMATNSKDPARHVCQTNVCYYDYSNTSKGYRISKLTDLKNLDTSEF